MTFDEFVHDLNWLAAHFEKRVTPALQDALFEELKHYQAQDWGEAAKAIARDGQQRAWPRLGQLLSAIFDAARVRQDKEWGIAKAREAEEAARLMSDEAKTDALRHVQVIIKAIGTAGAEKRKEAMQMIVDEFQEVAQEQAQAGCGCEHGLVFVKRHRKEWHDTVTELARCGVCPLGKGQMRILPWADPATNLLLQ